MLGLSSLGVCGVGLATALCLSGCSGSPPPHLTFSGLGDPVGASLPDIPENSPYLFSTYHLCVDKASVALVSVSLAKPVGSMKIVDWGVSAQSSGVGAEPGTVSQFPSFNHGPVTIACAPKGSGVEFDVSVENGTDAFTHTDGFQITYRSGGSKHDLLLPYRLNLCHTSTCPSPALSGGVSK